MTTKRAALFRGAALQQKGIADTDMDATTTISPTRWKAIQPVLRAIERHPNEHPSIAQLVAATRKSERSVHRAINWAVEAQILAVSFSTGRGHANCYKLLVKGATKGCHVAPPRRSTTYSILDTSSASQPSAEKARRRASSSPPAGREPTPDWWLHEVRIPRHGEDWPTDAEGRRLALLEYGRCGLCGMPIRRFEVGTTNVIPPTAVLVKLNGAEKAEPVHLPGGCPGSRPGGPGMYTPGDIAQEQVERRRAAMHVIKGGVA